MGAEIKRKNGKWVFDREEPQILILDSSVIIGSERNRGSGFEWPGSGQGRKSAGSLPDGVEEKVLACSGSAAH